MKKAEFLTELRKLSLTELENKVVSLEEEQLRLRCNKVIGQLNNVRALRHGRRNIARVQTVIQEKRQAAVAQG